MRRTLLLALLLGSAAWSAQAQELLQGIFAVDSQIAYGEGSAAAQLAPALEQRLHEALDQFVGAMARRPKPLEPGLLNERLLSARWSI